MDVNYNDYRVSSDGQLKKPHCSSHRCVLVIFFWELATWWGIPPVQVSTAATNVMLPHQPWSCCRPTLTESSQLFSDKLPHYPSLYQLSKGGSAFEDPTSLENIVSSIDQKSRSRTFSQYRTVSSIESSILSVVVTEKLWLFCLFSPKKSYFKAKNTHFWKFKSPRLPSPLISEQFVKKMPKKGHQKVP